MASEDQVERWERIETLLREVLLRCPPDLEGREWIEEWLDHNELGLAWEQLVQGLAAGQAPVAAADLDRLRDAADLMNLNPATLPGGPISRLEPRARISSKPG